jgi:hypothetical protein
MEIGSGKTVNYSRQNIYYSSRKVCDADKQDGRRKHSGDSNITPVIMKQHLGLRELSKVS